MPKRRERLGKNIWRKGGEKVKAYKCDRCGKLTEETHGEIRVGELLGTQNYIHIGIGGNPLYPRELCLDCAIAILEDGIARLKRVKDGC